jgi:hypothetical protein
MMRGLHVMVCGGMMVCGRQHVVFHGRVLVLFSHGVSSSETECNGSIPKT